MLYEMYTSRIDKMLIEAHVTVQSFIERRVEQEKGEIKRKAEFDRRSMGQRYRYHRERILGNE